MIFATIICSGRGKSRYRACLAYLCFKLGIEKKTEISYQESIVQIVSTVQYLRYVLRQQTHGFVCLRILSVDLFKKKCSVFFAVALWLWLKCWHCWPVDRWLISQAPTNRSVRMCLFRGMLRLVQVWKLVFARNRREAEYPALSCLVSFTTFDEVTGSNSATSECFYVCT